MNKLRISRIVALLSIVFFSACSGEISTGEGNEKEGHGEHGEHEEGESSTVSITPRQAETIGLKLGPIKSMPMNNTVKVTGMLELFPQDRAEVSPLIGGNVKNIFVIEGDEVLAGKILATMEHPVFIQMQQEYQMKFNSLDYLKLDYERQEKLFDEKVGSARDFQEARSAYLSTKAEVNGLGVKLEMLGLNVGSISKGKIFKTVPIVSPIDGYVHLVNINLGEFAGPMMGRKQIMFEITDNKRLHVDLRVYEKDIYKVKTGQKVFFTVANRPGHTLEATVESVGKAFEESPKSVHVHANIENQLGELLPGMYVEGRVAVDDREVLAVPEEAVVTEGEMAFIFIQNQEEEHGHEETKTSEEKDEHGHAEAKTSEEKDEHGHEIGGKKISFKKVKVKTGVHDAGYVEIKLFEPLPKDAIIALAGAYTLSSEMIKGELEHEH